MGAEESITKNFAGPSTENMRWMCSSHMNPRGADLDADQNRAGCSRAGTRRWRTGGPETPGRVVASDCSWITCAADEEEGEGHLHATHPGAEHEDAGQHHGEHHPRK